MADSYIVSDWWSLGAIPNDLGALTLQTGRLSPNDVQGHLSLARELGRPISSAFHFHPSVRQAQIEVDHRLGIRRAHKLMLLSDPITPQSIWFTRQLQGQIPHAHEILDTELAGWPSFWAWAMIFPFDFNLNPARPSDNLNKRTTIITDVFSLGQLQDVQHWSPDAIVEPINFDRGLNILRNLRPEQDKLSIRHSDTAIFLEQQIGKSIQHSDINVLYGNLHDYTVVVFHLNTNIPFGELITFDDDRMFESNWWLIADADASY